MNYKKVVIAWAGWVNSHIRNLILWWFGDGDNDTDDASLWYDHIAYQWRALHHITSEHMHFIISQQYVRWLIELTMPMRWRQTPMLCRLCTASSQTTKQTKNLFKTNQNIHFLFGFYLTFKSNAHLYFRRRIGSCQSLDGRCTMSSTNQTQVWIEKKWDSQ